MIFIRSFLLNLQFFTSIPIPFALPIDRKHMTWAVSTFPLLGLLQGVLTVLLLMMLVEWSPLSSVSITFVVWIFWIVFTGGIHLDGWMDTSDAFFSYREQEKRLEIMNDPRTGAFGVLSVIVLLSGRFLFLYELIGHGLTTTIYVLMIVIPFLSRGVMGAVLLLVPVAKQKGLAYFYQTNASNRALRTYPIYFILIVVSALFFNFNQWSILLVMIFVAVLTFFFIKRKAVTWFGGITGDVVGATEEGTEWLLWMTLWLWHYAAMV